MIRTRFTAGREELGTDAKRWWCARNPSRPSVKKDWSSRRAHMPLVFAGAFCKLPTMWKCSLLGAALATAALAQPAPSALDVANLREDVRGLTQRVGELSLKVEQLERENAELRQRTSALGSTYATVAQVDSAIADVNRAIKSAVGTAKKETLEQVSVQMEKLANATNHALESLAKSQAAATPLTAKAAAPATFSDNYPKEGTNYTVAKGDYLASIAKKTGAKAQDIINANKLSDPSHLTVGQTLFIPGGK
jgi:LysM repeat protein